MMKNFFCILAFLFVCGIASAQQNGVQVFKVSGGASRLDQSSYLQKLIDRVQTKTVLIEGCQVLINGSLDLKQKTLKLSKSSLTGRGKVFNGAIEATLNERVFDTTLPVANLSNKVISLKWFGAKGDGQSNDTKPVQRAVACINSSGGGLTLVIPQGTYVVGQQTTTGKLENDQYLYRYADLFAISNCSKPIVISGNGATIKMANGLRHGSFDTDGKPFHHAVPFYDRRYVAAAGIVFELKHNKSIRIENLKIDGNIQNLLIGGQWGDTGYQVPTMGISATENGNLELENVESNYNGQDGLMVSNYAFTKNDSVKTVTLLNSKFIGNGRQGFSWIGGNHLNAVNCHFERTGRTVNRSTGKPFASAPAAGVDIESEVGFKNGETVPVLCTNGRFTNCTFADNTGCGLVCPVSDGRSSHVSFTKCTFVGTTGWAIWPQGLYFQFTACKVFGPIVNVYPASGYNDPARTKFVSCLFSFDSSFFPRPISIEGYRKNGVSPYVDLGSAGYAFFSNCIFQTFQYPLPWSVKAEWNNCVFENNSPLWSFTKGLFTGNNRFTTRKAAADLSSSIIKDNLTINGVQRPQTGSVSN